MALAHVHSFTFINSWTKFTKSGYFGMGKRGA